MTGDAELLRRYAEEKSEDAFAELVRRHLGLVYFAALRQVGDSHRAQDVTQAVFADLARKAGSLWRRPVLASWLHTSTRFAATKARRSEQRRQRHEQEAETMNALLRDEATTAEWEQLRPLIDDTLHELNERDREAVLLRFFEGRAFGEIGEALDVTEDAARMRVERALGKLHALLVRRGVTSTASALGIALAQQASMAAPAGLTTIVTGAALVAGSTTAAAGWIGFMSTTNWAGGFVASLLLIMTLGAGGYAVRARGMAESALLAERGNYDVLATRVLAARTRALAFEAEASQVGRNAEATQAGVTAREPAATTAAAATAEFKTAFDREAAGDAFMAKHPAVKAALGDYARARVNFRFGELYHRLGLTSAQIERFQDLVAEAGMGADGPDGNEISLLWRRGRPRADVEPELHELLGTEGLDLFHELDGREESRTMAAHVAGALWFSETPLTTAQAEKLEEVFLNNRVKSREKNYEQVDWEATMARAREFLSPPQLAVLEGEEEADQETLALNQPMSSAATPAPAK